MSIPSAREVWFVTGSQAMYGEETLRQVAGQSTSIARALDADSGISVRIVWKPVLADATAIRRLCLDATADDSCVGLIAWGAPHHTALTSSLIREHLTDLADMIGVELLVIDADTTAGQFGKEIRWNQAYYRLAQGL